LPFLGITIGTTGLALAAFLGLALAAFLGLALPTEGVGAGVEAGAGVGSAFFVAVSCTFFRFDMITATTIPIPITINKKTKPPMIAGFILLFTEIFYCHRDT
jgi:hypothetical protein